MDPQEQFERQQEKQPLFSEREKTSESAHDAFLRTGFISTETMRRSTSESSEALMARRVHDKVKDRQRPTNYGEQALKLAEPTEESRFAHLSDREKKKAKKDLESKQKQAQKQAGSDAFVTGDTLDMQKELQAYRKDIALGKAETGGDKTLRGLTKDDSGASMPKQWSYAMRTSTENTLQKFSRDWKKGGNARVDLRGLQEDLRDQAAFRDKIRERAQGGTLQLQADFQHFEDCVAQLTALIKICANANGLNENGAFVTRAEAQSASERKSDAVKDYFEAVNHFDGGVYKKYQVIAEAFLAKDEALQKLSAAAPEEESSAAAPFAMKHFARDYGYFKHNMDNVPPEISADNQAALNKAYAEYVSVLRAEELRQTRAALLLEADQGAALSARHLADEEAERALMGTAQTLRKEYLEKVMLFVSGGRLPDEDIVYRIMEMDFGISADKQRAILRHFADSRTAGAEEAYLQWQMGHANDELENEQHEVSQKRGQKIVTAAAGDAAGMGAITGYLRERLRANVFTHSEMRKIGANYDNPADREAIEKAGCKIYGDWRDMMEYKIKIGDSSYLTRMCTLLSGDNQALKRRLAFNKAVPSHAGKENVSTRDVTRFLPLEADDEEIKQTLDDTELLLEHHKGKSMDAARAAADTPAEAEARARFTARYVDCYESVKQEVIDVGVDLNAAVKSPDELAVRAFKLFPIFQTLQQTTIGVNGKLALDSRTADAVLFCSALKLYVYSLVQYSGTSLEERTAAIAAGEWDFAAYMAAEARKADYTKARNGAYDR